MQEHRRSRRRRAPHQIQVYNAITDEAIGRIGNLSVDGMLLISNRSVPEDALFQLAFVLPCTGGRPRRIEIGVHEQWTEACSYPGQYWAGFRIIDIGPDDYRALSDWVGNPVSPFADLH